MPSPASTSTTAKSTRSTPGSSYIVRIRPTRSRPRERAASTRPPSIRRIADMDAIIICVPTPLNEYREPDMSYIANTARSHRAAPARRPDHRPRKHHLSRHHRRSTRPDPRKGQQARTQGRAQRRIATTGFYVAFSPEREDPGNTTSLVTTFPKSSADSIQPPPNWLPPFTAPSSAAPFRSPRPPPRR